LRAFNGGRFLCQLLAVGERGSGGGWVLWAGVGGFDDDVVVGQELYGFGAVERLCGCRERLPDAVWVVGSLAVALFAADHVGADGCPFAWMGVVVGASAP
jgi:hypothetical protein